MTFNINAERNDVINSEFSDWQSDLHGKKGGKAQNSSFISKQPFFLPLFKKPYLVFSSITKLTCVNWTRLDNVVILRLRFFLQQIGGLLGIFHSRIVPIFRGFPQFLLGSANRNLFKWLAEVVYWIFLNLNLKLNFFRSLVIWEAYFQFGCFSFVNIVAKDVLLLWVLFSSTFFRIFFSQLQYSLERVHLFIKYTIKKEKLKTKSASI